MPTLPTGLIRNKNSGVYYLRRRIPSDILICYPGKKELTWSLKTKDRKTAVERHRREEARLTAEWDARRKKLLDAHAKKHAHPTYKINALTPDVVDAICGQFEVSSLASDELLRENGQYDAQDIEEYKAGYASANSMLKTAVAIGDTDLLLPLLEQFLTLYRFDLDVPKSDMNRLALAYARTAIRVNEKLLKRYEGEDVPTPAPTEIRVTPLLSEVIQAYAAYYERLAEIHFVITTPGAKTIGQRLRKALTHAPDSAWPRQVKEWDAVLLAKKVKVFALNSETLELTPVEF